MSKYFYTDEKSIDGLEMSQISELYTQGYVTTRLPEMQQTRSLRIDLTKFELSSENRRILGKTEDLDLFTFDLPLPQNETNWRIHALGKKFYTEKFDAVEFSASKIRAIINGKGNYNALLTYYRDNTLPNNSTAETIDHTKTLGYAICYKTESLIHYSFPFYDLETETTNLGMGMMLKAILHAKEAGIKHFYIGSYTRPKDRYKLQFKGLEWWNQAHWSDDLAKLKTTI